MHELAKELGIESKIVLAKLQEMGEYVKSASSPVEAHIARRLREALVGFHRSAGGRKSADDAREDVQPDPATPKRAAAPRAMPLPALQPMTRPASAYDIEVAAAEARAAILKAEQDAAVKAVQRAAREPIVRQQHTPDERTTRLNPGSSAGVEASSDSTAGQVSALLLLWDKLSSLAPNPDRCVDHLANRGGLPKSDVERLRTVRNQCAHPAGRGWPSGYELAVALATGRELERRLIHQGATRNRTR